MSLQQRPNMILTPETVRTISGLPVYPVSASILQGTCLLIVSRGGGGKTTAAASIGDSIYLPPGKKQLIIDLEGNVQSIRHRDDCEFLPVASWAQFEAVVAAAGAGELRNYYHTVTTDNISELIDIKTREIFGEEQLKLDENTSWPQWNRITRDVLAKIRELRNVSRRDGTNMIFTAWDQPNKKKPYYADIQANPALQDKIPGIISFIGYIDTDERDQSRVMHFEFSNQHVSKWQCDPTDAAANVPLKFKIDIKNGPHLGTVIDTVRGDAKWPFPIK